MSFKLLKQLDAMDCAPICLPVNSETISRQLENTPADIEAMPAIFINGRGLPKPINQKFLNIYI